MLQVSQLHGFNVVLGEFDPYLADVLLLMHMDGPNDSTNFIDEKNHTVTNLTGQGKISTAQSKFGGSSGSFNGSTGYLDGSMDEVIVSDPPDVTFDGPFTIEFWVKFNSVTTQQQFVYSSGSPFFYFALNTSGNLQFYLYGATVSFNPVVSLDTAWHHVAVTRDGANLIRTFLDGSLVEDTITNATDGPATATLMLGGQHPGLNGYLDDLRITKGVCRYTTSFSVPTMPYPNS